MAKDRIVLLDALRGLAILGILLCNIPLVFGGRGPVLYGKLDRPALAAIVVVTWIVQILASRWWLKRFSMGPLEWVWRLAYRGPTPLRRGPA